MQRILLRFGCLILNDRLKIELSQKTLMNSDTEVREACIEAMRIIAEVSGHSIFVLNDFFWPLGRSCCNETTLCTDSACMKSPCTFFEMVKLTDHTHCVFEKICKGSKEKSFRNLWEPNVSTHYY